MKRPPVIVVQLVHISGPLKGQIQTFSEERISIGRKPGCYLQFPPDLTCVSRIQAEIVREGNQFKLIDHSSNGTFVNGKEITEAYLKNGDILEFSKGGPKVSFLTTIQEMEAEPKRPMPSVRPAKPVEAPQPESRKKLIQPLPEKQGEIRGQETGKTLTIQYGATIRSFSKPVVIGRNPACDFVLDIPAILDKHAQFFFSQNQYWIKDLTGQRSVRLNHKPIEIQTSVTINDEIALSPRGPVFRVVGDGRLAEVPEPPAEKPMISRPQQQRQTEESRGLLSKVKDYLDNILK
jgi:pSer/pThr/pTyr-binding forkhead associated (FHA) protein